MEKTSHVDNIFPHRFRKTFACNAIAHGMPMEEVKEHLGHRNIQTTFRYADITDTILEKSYRQFCE
jgi:site-specific recombinase XerD